MFLPEALSLGKGCELPRASNGRMLLQDSVRSTSFRCWVNDCKFLSYFSSLIMWQRDCHLSLSQYLAHPGMTRGWTGGGPGGDPLGSWSPLPHASFEAWAQRGRVGEEVSYYRTSLLCPVLDTSTSLFFTVSCWVLSAVFLCLHFLHLVSKFRE